MKPEEKKAFILLKALIFHYHGLDEDEEKILLETADELNAEDELTWGPGIHKPGLHVCI